MRKRKSKFMYLYMQANRRAILCGARQLSITIRMDRCIKINRSVFGPPRFETVRFSLLSFLFLFFSAASLVGARSLLAKFVSSVASRNKISRFFVTR